jgi:hypothetical protein
MVPLYISYCLSKCTMPPLHMHACTRPNGVSCMHCSAISLIKRARYIQCMQCVSVASHHSNVETGFSGVRVKKYARLHCFTIKSRAFSAASAIEIQPASVTSVDSTSSVREACWVSLNVAKNVFRLALNARHVRSLRRHGSRALSCSYTKVSGVIP